MKSQKELKTKLRNVEITNRRLTPSQLMAIEQLFKHKEASYFFEIRRLRKSIIRFKAMEDGKTLAWTMGQIRHFEQVIELMESYRREYLSLKQEGVPYRVILKWTKDAKKRYGRE